MNSFDAFKSLLSGMLLSALALVGYATGYVSAQKDQLDAWPDDPITAFRTAYRGWTVMPAPDQFGITISEKSPLVMAGVVNQEGRVLAVTDLDTVPKATVLATFKIPTMANLIFDAKPTTAAYRTLMIMDTHVIGGRARFRIGDDADGNPLTKSPAP